MLLIPSVLAVLGTFSGMASDLPALHVRGKQMVGADGKPVVLAGCNLGNWLMIELWMLGLDGVAGVTDQADLFRTLDQRFGRAERDRLMNVYRANWITDSDFAKIKSLGFNLVRLPMDYRLFEDDERPRKLRADAFRWIDWCVDHAAKHGIYVILDMHGIQGGQSPYEHTGASDQNQFWTSEPSQRRAAWLWEQIAARYRQRGTVVAYDLMNEPYGGTHDQQSRLSDMLHKAVRRGDPEKLILVHGHYDGFAHYGDPRQRGWTNTGFQMHYYPGLFGNGQPTMVTQARHLANLAGVAKQIDALNVPFLVGEMNPVFKSAGGAETLRRTYDLHRQYGWMTTMWSYKAVSKEGGFGDAYWGVVTNPKPLPSLNFRTDSKAAIENWFKTLGSTDWQISPEIKTWMTASRPKFSPLPEVPKPRTDIPRVGNIEGWSSAEIGSAKRGGPVGKAEAFELYGSGSDIWGAEDSFQFLHQSIEGDFVLGVTVDGQDDIEQYAKAGLMIRADEKPGAAFALLSVFPSGELQFAIRTGAGEGAKGVASAESKMPNLELRLSRRGSKVKSEYRQGGEWKSLGEQDVPALSRAVLVGPVALSHDAQTYNRVRYRHLYLSRG